jgi:hypothetical protein
MVSIGKYADARRSTAPVIPSSADVRRLEMPVRNEIDILRFDRDLRQTYERYIYTNKSSADA